MRAWLPLLILALSLLTGCVAPTPNVPTCETQDTDDEVTRRNGTSRFLLHPTTPTLNPGDNLTMHLTFTNDDCAAFEFQRLPAICGGAVWSVSDEQFAILTTWNQTTPEMYVPFFHSCGIAVGAPIDAVPPTGSFEQTIEWNGTVGLEVARSGQPTTAGAKQWVPLGPGDWPLAYGIYGSWDATGNTTFHAPSTTRNADSPLRPDNCESWYSPHQDTLTNATIQSPTTDAALGTPVPFWINFTVPTPDAPCVLIAGSLGMTAHAADFVAPTICIPKPCGVGLGTAVLLLTDGQAADVRLHTNWTGPAQPGAYDLHVQAGILKSAFDAEPVATFRWTTPFAS